METRLTKSGAVDRRSATATAQAAAMTPEQRQERAKKAIAARWARRRSLSLMEMLERDEAYRALIGRVMTVHQEGLASQSGPWQRFHECFSPSEPIYREAQVLFVAAWLGALVPPTR